MTRLGFHTPIYSILVQPFCRSQSHRKGIKGDNLFHVKSHSGGTNIMGVQIIRDRDLDVVSAEPVELQTHLAIYSSILF